MSTKHVRLPEPVYEEARRLKDERGFATLGEAVRAAMREAGYEV